MSMTREEARIEIQSLKDTFEELEPGGTRTQFALKIALSALRPVSRERVDVVINFLKLRLEYNEENGIVSIPKFAVEQMIERLEAIKNG